MGRLATYLQAYGDLMVDTNRWDPAVLATFRADEMVAGFRSAIDVGATTEQLEHIATLIPDEWLAPSASGSAARCASAVRDQPELGADAVSEEDREVAVITFLVTASGFSVLGIGSAFWGLLLGFIIHWWNGHRTAAVVKRANT